MERDGLWERALGLYCERGHDPGFWAEPLNATTNLAFVLVGVAALAALSRGVEHDRRALSWLLAGLVVAIGVGSFLFHTLATRWAGAADTIPILLFMLAAVYGVARRGFEASAWASALAMLAFLALGWLAARVGGALELPRGVTGYGPALLVLVGSGAALAAARRPGGVTLLLAGAVFAVSLTLRSLDQPLCPWFTIGDWRIGAHFLWHLLNALTLALVVRALVNEAGGPVRQLGPAAPSRP